MNEEKKEVQANTSGQASDQKKPEENVSAPQVNYKEAAERLEKELKQAQYNIEGLKRDLKETKPEIDEESIVNKVKEEAAKELEKFKSDLVTDIIDDEIAKTSSNEEERKLIKMIYENKLVRSGFSRTSIKNDIEAAKLLANRPVIEKKIEEMKQSIISNQTKNTSGSTSPQEQSSVSDVDGLSKPEIEFVQSAIARGFKREDVIRQLKINKSN